MNETEIRAIAIEAAQEAISQLRKTQKRGRNDTAGGSKKIGDITRSHRERMGLSINDVAQRTGLHPTSIGKIESGQRGMSLKTFAKIVFALSPPYANDVLAESLR